MSDEKFKNIGTPEIRIIEECGEIIQAVAKGDRFGWFKHHPDRPDRTNLDDLQAEVEDLLGAVEDLFKSLQPTCRVCGCTDDDCSQCIEAQGEPCYWVEADLCSRCAEGC